MDSYFYNRHSYRTFSNKEVSDEKIKEILEAAMRAPTTGNMQLYSVVVTRDKDQKEQLAPSHFSQPAFLNAPIILTFCADFNRFVKWCQQRNATPGYDNIQSFIAAALDTTILAQQFVTIAELDGMATCYLGTTTYNPDKIAKVLELPKRVIPVITVALGYPDAQPVETDRLGVNAILHSETYRDYSPEDIDKIYKEKENREDSRCFIAENNKETLAQVFTDVRYPKSNNEFFSEVFKKYLKDNFLEIS